MYGCVPLNSIPMSVLLVGITSVELPNGIISVEFVIIGSNTSITSISISSVMMSVVVLFCNPKINGSV